MIPARRAILRTIRPAPCRSSRLPSAVRKIGTVAAFAGGQVDRPGGAGRERYGDDLAALSGDGHGPVPALRAPVLDVGAGGLGDPQPVQCQERDQRMLGRRAEPGGDQQGTQLVAVQGGGTGLIVQPRAADVRGWRVVREFFFDRVPAEPGDGAQPAGDGGPGAAPGFQVPGEALDAGTADGEKDQGRGAAPSGELAQVQRVGLAGQPAVRARYPASASRPGSVNAGWIVARAVDGAAVVIGYLPARLRPGRLGQLRVPAIKRKPNVSRCSRSHHVATSQEAEPRRLLEKRSSPAEYSLPQSALAARFNAYRSIRSV